MEGIKSEGEPKKREWHFCEVCGLVQIARSCFLVASRFRDDNGKDSFVLAKQFICLDKNGKPAVRYSNAIRFYSVRVMREVGKMLAEAAQKFEGK